MKILISGSGGLIGSALVSYLESRDHNIYKLVRRKPLSDCEISLDFEHDSHAKDKMEGFDAVIHLAGENIGEGRWTGEKKKRILFSRVDGTRLLSERLAALRNKPKVFISASAVGFYGDRGNKKLTEADGKGTGFLADVCSEWEAVCAPAAEAGIRVVNPRFGVVLSKDAKIIKMLKVLFNLNLGGVIGGGGQYMSWISMHDLVRAIEFILLNPRIEGAVNVVSPGPVTNREFTKSMAKALRRYAFFRIPSFIIKIIFGAKGKEMLLFSIRTVPEKLTKLGFCFFDGKINTTLIKLNR